MTLTDFHQMLTGEAPGQIAASFYATGKSGFSDKTLDAERFAAVAVLTLFKTTRTSMERPDRVVMLVPPSADKWVISQLDGVSAMVCEHCKKIPGTKEARTRLARMIGDWFKVLFVASRALQLPEQPEAWTSFGFSIDDPIPDWMRDGLMVT